MKTFYLIILSCFLSFNIYCQVPTIDLIGNWNFTSNLIDNSGNGYDGINNGVIFTSDRFGMSNSACYFNGTSSFVIFPNLLQQTILHIHFVRG